MLERVVSQESPMILIRHNVTVVAHSSDIEYINPPLLYLTQTIYLKGWSSHISVTL